MNTKIQQSHQLFICVTLWLVNINHKIWPRTTTSIRCTWYTTLTTGSDHPPPSPHHLLNVLCPIKANCYTSFVPCSESEMSELFKDWGWKWREDEGIKQWVSHLVLPAFLFEWSKSRDTKFPPFHVFVPLYRYSLACETFLSREMTTF